MSAPTGSLSDPTIVRGARRLRTLSILLEIGLYVVIAGSVAALASVPPWAYIPLWYACFALLALTVEHQLTVRALRLRLGSHRFAFHPTGLWIVLEEERPYGMETWSFDLGRPQPRGPLLLPGLLFLALVLLQIVPLPPALVVALNRSQAELVQAGGGGWRPLTLSVPDTLRGLGFLASLLALHATAAVVFDRREARGRLRKFLACLGLVLALEGLAQLASGTRLLFGFYLPTERDGNNLIFGPFVNRNHFAAYMLMVVPLSLGLVVDSFRAYARRVGTRGNVRRWLVGLQSPEGTAFVYFLAPALATLAALVATTSRGALAAFAVGLLAAVGSARAGGQRWAWVFPLLLAVLALSFFGLARLERRFGLSVKEASGRTVVWRDALAEARGLWPMGSGFNTFGTAVSRVTVWTLPKGASPWREPFETSVAQAPRLGFRTYLERPDLAWYREAHNDYVQVLVEAGVPGLLLVLAALATTLNRARRDPWLLAALVGIACHALVEFGLQVPAVAVLFACIATGSEPERRSDRPAVSEETAPA